MAIRNTLPTTKADPIIKFGDTGAAVKKIQQFLQSLSYVKTQQDFLKDFGKGFSFTDQAHFGKFERDTRLFVSEYQKKNKERILKIGKYTTVEFASINGRVDWATWKAMLQDQGASSATTPPAPTQQKLDPPLPNPIPDPPKASEVPQASHFVKTVDPKSRLALRKAAAFVKVSKNSWEDTEAKGELITMMDNGTLLRVITPGVGFECEWHQVVVVDQDPKWAEARSLGEKGETYCYAEFVAPLEGTPELLPTECPECRDRSLDSIERPTTFPDWIKMDECSPFFDEWTCSYYITVITNHTTTNKTVIKQQKQEALVNGVISLLSFYNKQRTIEDINKLLSSYEFASVPENGWYLDSRPGSYLRVLVKIPAKYFDAIPEEPDNLEDVVTKDNIPEGWKTVHFDPATITEKIEQVSRHLKSVNEDLLGYRGPIPGLNLYKSSERLKQFTAVFQKLVEINKYDYNVGETYELGFLGDCFELIYVLRKDEKNTSIPLRIGFECFRLSEPIVYEEVMGYVFYLEDMIKDIERNTLSWLDFIQTYTCPPPIFTPSDKPKKPTPKLGDPVKTTTEKDREDLFIDDEFKREIWSLQRLEEQFVGDPLLDCDNIRELLNRLKTLEDVYTEVLNKVNIASIAGAAMDCFGFDLDLEELAKAACRLALRKLPVDKLNLLIEQFPADDIQNIQTKVQELSLMPVGVAVGDDAAKLRKAIEINISCDKLTASINTIEPGLVKNIYDKLKPPSIEEIKEGFNSFKIPTITLPDALPTEDIMESIGVAILSSVKTAMSSVLISLVKEILLAICAACSKTSQSFGEENINDIIERSDADPINIARQISIDFGLEGDESVSLKDFFDDLSALLLPREICLLLNGSASDEVINIVLNLIRTQYVSLTRKINTPAAVIELFLRLGELFDKTICEDILTEEEPIIDACGLRAADVRTSLLQNKMDAEQIRQQLDTIQEQNLDRIEKIFGLIDPENDLFKNSVPSLASDPCAVRVKGRPSIIPNDPPSVEVLNKRTINSMFDGIEMSFTDDVQGFIFSLLSIEREKEEQNLEDAKKSRSAYLKSLEDLGKLTPTDTQALMADPDLMGAGQGKIVTTVAPNLRKSFKDDSNFRHKNSLRDPRAEYEFKVSINNIEKRLETLRNSLFEGRPQKKKEFEDLLASLNKEKLSAGDAATTGKFATIVGRFLEITDDICSENVKKDNKELTFLLADLSKLLSNKTIIQYNILDYIDENSYFKDRYSVYINEHTNDIPLAFTGAEDLSAELKELLRNFSFKAGLSVQQQVFSGVLDSIFKEVSKNVGSASIDKSILETEVFHKILISFVSQLAEEVSNSDFFDREKLLDADIVPKTNIIENCSPIPATETHLLDVEELKQKVRLDYEKFSNHCEEADESLNPMESAGINGIVNTVIRLFTIDYLLRALFVFKIFSISDIFKDNLASKYLVKKIKARLQSEGEDFYEIFSKFALRNLQIRGSRLIDPFAEDPSDPNLEELPVLKDLTGETAVEYLIKENAKKLSEVFDEVLKSKDEPLFNKFVNKWIPNTTFSLNRSEKIAEKVYEDLLRDNPSGGFIIEKYARLCGGAAAGEVVQDVIALDALTKTNQSDLKETFKKQPTLPKQANGLVYGIRLTYVPKEKIFNVSDIKFARKEKSYKIGKYNPIPLISFEEKKQRTRPLVGLELDAAYEALTQGLIETPNFKLFFDYVFPLRRLITLLAIYNIEVLSFTIDGVEDIFETTRQQLKIILRGLQPDDSFWWNKEDEAIEGKGNNTGIRQERLNNVSTQGSHPSLARMAAMTIPLMVKGMAERFDPSYKLIKGLFNVGSANLNWGDVPKVAPINIFGPFGFGPPIGPFGMMALGVDLLPGERRQKEELKVEEQDDKNEGCEE